MLFASIVQFDNFLFADEDWTAYIGLDDSRNQFQTTPGVVTRVGSYPFVNGGSLTPKTIPVWFEYKSPTGDADTYAVAVSRLLGKLAADDPNPKRLVGRDKDGNLYQTTAVFSNSPGWDRSQGPQRIKATFTAAKPYWEHADLTGVFGSAISNYGQVPALPVPNIGHATTEMLLQLTPTVTAHLATTALVGWKYRRQVTFTNGPQTWSNRPLFIDLGDTTAWVGDGAKSNGDDVLCLLNGQVLPRMFQNWNALKTFAVIVPPPINAGETVTLDFVYGNASAPTPTALQSQMGSKFPPIMLHSDAGTSSGGTNATLVDSTKTWSGSTNWIGATVWILSGPLSIRSRKVIAQPDAHTLTYDSILPAGTYSGLTYLVVQSSNARHSYNAGNFFSSAVTLATHGRWFSDRQLIQPALISFDAPASWSPVKVADNSDRFAQKSITNQGGFYYSWLNVYRTWQGGGASGQLTTEDGIADGVQLHSCLPILAMHSDIVVSNDLNGMAKAVIMGRGAGAEDWMEFTSATQTASGTYSIDLTLPAGTDFFDVAQALIPSDDEGVIRTDRARDNGSTTADGDTRTSVTTGGAHTLLKNGNSNSDPVQTTGATPTDISVPNGTTVERDGRWSGSYRGVIYNDGTNDWHGWLTTAQLAGGDAGGLTFTDSGKSWLTNELVGMKVTFGKGPNEWVYGKTRTVASNTANTVTFTVAMRATVPDGTAYDMRQPKTTARLIDNGNLWVDFDISDITISAPTAKQDVYQFATELAVGDVYKIFQRKNALRIGLDGPMVFAQTTESLMLDCENRQAWIQNNSTLATVQTLTDPAVVAQQVQWNDVKRRYDPVRAARWLPIPMGERAGADVISANFIKDGAYPSGWTAAFAPHAAAGTWGNAGGTPYEINITANSGAANAHIDLILDYLIPFNPGDRVGYMVPLQINNANLQSRLGIIWFNASNVEISRNFSDSFTEGINTWQPASFVAIDDDPSQPLNMPADTDFIAPTNAVAAKWVIRVIDLAGATVGRVRIGDTAIYGTGFAWGAQLLYVTETNGNLLNVTGTFRERYLG